MGDRRKMAAYVISAGGASVGEKPGYLMKIDAPLRCLRDASSRLNARAFARCSIKTSRTTVRIKHRVVIALPRIKRRRKRGSSGMVRRVAAAVSSGALGENRGAAPAKRAMGVSVAIGNRKLAKYVRSALALRRTSGGNLAGHHQRRASRTIAVHVAARFHRAYLKRSLRASARALRAWRAVTPRSGISPRKRTRAAGGRSAPMANVSQQNDSAWQQ